jgi:UDP-glucose 4-epimerase
MEDQMVALNRKTYLVTGGCGFIGSNLVDKLLTDGCQVIVLDDLSTGKRSNLSTSAELVIGDIRDKSLVSELMQQVDGCFHLAAIASVERSNQDWVGTHEVNLTGTITIFNAARQGKQGVPIPVVYASSSAVYGDNKNIPFTETSTTNPLTAYAVDKLACELHAQVAWLVFQVPTIGFRFFNIYGPRQNPNSVYSGVISIFLDKISQSQTITIYGDGSQTRDFVYVEDAIRFLTSAMEHLITKNLVHSVFNVGTGQSISINQLSTLIGNLLNKQVEVIHTEPRKGDVHFARGCPLYASQELKQRTEYSLAQGLEKYISQYF